MRRLEHRVAVVTGAGRGLGKAIARGLAREGANLVLAARSADELAAAAGELAAGVGILTVSGDVTDERAVDDLFRQSLERFGQIDLVVNNAGAFDGGPLDELSVEAWDKVIAVNLRAPFLCTRAALRVMKRQGGGRIINIGPSRRSGCDPIRHPTPRRSMVCGA